MRKITKALVPPASFTDWVRRKPADQDENQWFEALYQQQQWGIVSDLSLSNAREQYYLCAYCCDRITGNSADTVNEHVEARKINRRRSLDHLNIVASCRTKKQCDAAHGSQALPLTPLMPECETELRFRLSGRVEGLTERAREAIRVLNLGDTEKNNKALIEKRKQLVDGLIWANYGGDPDQLELEEDEELIRMLIDDLARPQNGKLEPFAPVLINILSTRLAA